jgi:hypothetical protein
VVNEEVILYAFLAQVKSYGLPTFENQTVLSASLEEYKNKIRQNANCPDSEVVIIEPKDWNPPEIKNVSQGELASKFPLVMIRVQEKMKKLKLPFVSTEELIRNGNVMPNPLSGKIFFVYKMPRTKKTDRSSSEGANAGKAHYPKSYKPRASSSSKRWVYGIVAVSIIVLIVVAGVILNSSSLNVQSPEMSLPEAPET